jgi:hypothetical protein
VEVLLPVFLFIIGVIVFVGAVTYLADQSVEHHERGNG